MSQTVKKPLAVGVIPTALPSRKPRGGQRQKQMHSALDEVIQLKDWNGPGTVPTAPAAIAKAKKFIQLLSTLDTRIPVPFIGPTGGGGVSFEWAGERTNGKELVIFLLPAESVSYVAAQPAIGHEISGETEKLDDLRQHLAWLVSNN